MDRSPSLLDKSTANCQRRRRHLSAEREGRGCSVETECSRPTDRPREKERSFPNCCRRSVSPSASHIRTRCGALRRLTGHRCETVRPSVQVAAETDRRGTRSGDRGSYVHCSISGPYCYMSSVRPSVCWLPCRRRPPFSERVASSLSMLLSSFPPGSIARPSLARSLNRRRSADARYIFGRGLLPMTDGRASGGADEKRALAGRTTERPTGRDRGAVGRSRSVFSLTFSGSGSLGGSSARSFVRSKQQRTNAVATAAAAVSWTSALDLTGRAPLGLPLYVERVDQVGNSATVVQTWRNRSRVSSLKYIYTWALNW